MVMLVSTQQAKDRCKLDGFLSDLDLSTLIEQCSAGVLNYLKQPFENFAESSGNVPLDSNQVPVNVPQEIQLAVLCWVGIIAENPTAAGDKFWERGYPPDAVVSILTPKRGPAFA